MKEILAKIFGGAAGGVADKLTNVVDKFVRTKDEKAQFEKEMTQIFIQAEAEQQKLEEAVKKTKEHIQS